MKFQGYERPDGSVGVRNIILVMAVADCSEPVARLIAEDIPGAVPITQHYGCIPGEMVANTLIGVAQNGNVGAVLLVGMGCEGMPAHALAKIIKKSGKPVEWISIQELGGTRKAIVKGKEILRAMSEQVLTLKRTEIDAGRLVV
ncbi:MAG: UxaA family hydrolase, partial [Deltaproteobacteria bacterium]|nr:UxaA family hydrolase [Deltaproteobacteria bacterium]